MLNNNNHYPKNKNHKNYPNNYYNKVIKVNKTFNRDNNNNDIYNYYSNYRIEPNKLNENSINISCYKTTNEYSFNYGTNTFNDSKYNYKSNNNSNNSSYSKYKYIKIKDGEMQLFHKKNQTNQPVGPVSLNFKNYFNKEKIKSRQNHKHKNLKYENYTTNKTINQFLLNNTNNNKEIDTCLEQNKPIRLNYNKDIILDRNGKENSNMNKNSYEYYKDLEQKINNLKNNIGFEGDNDEFIEYLKILKLKADITNLVGYMFNNDDKFNEEEIKKCFYKLEQLKKNQNDNENLLNIYKYIAEQLLPIQSKHKIGKNGNKFNFSNDI